MDISSLEQLAAKLSGYRFRISTEASLQEDLEKVLQSLEIPHKREFRLPGGPIDFRLGDGTGIECKVAGGAQPVLRQLRRYIGQPEITQILLVTSKIQHLPDPNFRELGGKPILKLWVGKLT